MPRLVRFIASGALLTVLVAAGCAHHKSGCCSSGSSRGSGGCSTGASASAPPQQANYMDVFLESEGSRSGQASNAPAYPVMAPPTMSGSGTR